MTSFSGKHSASNSSLDEDDIELFRDAVKGTRTLANDKVQPLPAKQKLKRKQRQLEDDEIANTARAASDYFSDQFHGVIDTDPLRFVADGESGYLLKQLRRGDYVPEMLLDLHGMTLADAKQELAAMLKACEKQLIECCCVMHGHGSGRLKQQIPHWLIQYPRIRAFHQAPREWGGDAAIVLLIERAD